MQCIYLFVAGSCQSESVSGSGLKKWLIECRHRVKQTQLWEWDRILLTGVKTLVPGTAVGMDTTEDVEIVQEVILLNDTDFKKMFDQTETRMKHVRLQDHDYTADTA